MKSSLAFIIIILVSLVSVVSGVGCANIIPPSGGPRDSTAPVLLSASPKDSSTNFRGNKIVLTFDEYVDLRDVQNNLLFTPTFENNPMIEARGKTITVRLKDSLEPNTTYILNFGNAIRDVNEDNALKNFVYTFSTGAGIDSLEIAGRVLLAETGRPDSTLIVVLHKDLSDSAIIKSRPTYISRVDANGNFLFRNLPSGRFAIYALGEAGLSRRYQNKTQLFAFADTAAVAGRSKNLTLFAYREQPLNVISQVGTVATRIPSDRRLQFTSSTTSGQQDLFKDFTLTFNAPITKFDSTKISLATDSIYKPEPFSAALDSSRKQITIRTAWQEAKSYHLMLNKDFAEDSAGRKLLKSDTLHFSTKKNSDYAKITLRIKNLDATKNPVLQFVQNERVVFSAPIKSGTFSQTLFNPGEYQLRILFDRNGNGKWDAGSFFGSRRQPEIVQPIERTITVKPNWDNEFDITL